MFGPTNPAAGLLLIGLFRDIRYAVQLRHLPAEVLLDALAHKGMRMKAHIPYKVNSPAVHREYLEV